MSGFEVCEKRCDQCLFSSEKIVDRKRKAQILRDCARADSHFICHKFSGVNPDAQTCCRGFYDMGRPTNLMRIAMRLGALNFVPLPAEARPSPSSDTPPNPERSSPNPNPSVAVLHEEER